MGSIEREHPDRGLVKSIDWRLIAVYLLLVLIGWINIYAAVHSSEPASIFSWSCRSGKQFVWIMTSFILAALILFAISPRLWEVISTPAYLVVLVLLVAVIFLGVEVKGSRSWFAFGPVRFQPAEISKISTSLLLAAVMSKQDFRIRTMRGLATAVAIIGIPMLVILGEKETGSALVYVGFIFALYREGLSGWYITLIGLAILLFILTLTTNWWISAIVLFVLCFGVALTAILQTRRKTKNIIIYYVRNAILVFAAGMALIAATGFIFNNILQDHQRKRIEVLLGMKDDPSGVGYNVRQSMIAIGSGGLTGKGYLHGSQTSFGFVPEQSTDFIFCTVGEEWGFVGCVAVIVLYLLLIWWIVQDAEESRSSFARIYGYCFASCLFMHLFINIGMTIGLMPVIGIPLPFLSYGGSSIWAFTTMLFIFLALIRQERKYF